MLNGGGWGNNILNLFSRGEGGGGVIGKQDDNDHERVANRRRTFYLNH